MKCLLLLTLAGLTLGQNRCTAPAVTKGVCSLANDCPYLNIVKVNGTIHDYIRDYGGCGTRNGDVYVCCPIPSILYDSLCVTSSSPLSTNPVSTTSNCPPVTTSSETRIGKPQELLPTDCQEILHSGRRQSGVYKIFPVGMPGGVNVYCDQESKDGGWIVFLQRQQQTPQVDFVRPFEDYAKGFGEPGREFWLGNRILHAITGNSNYELRAEATSLEGDSRYASWGTFRVGSEDTQFTLTVDDYDVSQSTLGDGMSKQGTYGWQSNQMKFSTYDKDNEYECSLTFGRVGWWMDACSGALPTAAVIGESLSPIGLNWEFWDNNSSSHVTFLSWVQMKIRAH